jgi:hypothetical protein
MPGAGKYSFMTLRELLMQPWNTQNKHVSRCVYVCTASCWEGAIEAACYEKEACIYKNISCCVDHAHRMKKIVFVRYACCCNMLGRARENEQYALCEIRYVRTRIQYTWRRTCTLCIMPTHAVALNLAHCIQNKRTSNELLQSNVQHAYPVRLYLYEIYVCECACACVCVHTCIYIYIYIYMYIYIHTYIYIYTHIHRKRRRELLPLFCPCCVCKVNYASKKHTCVHAYCKMQTTSMKKMNLWCIYWRHGE